MQSFRLWLENTNLTFKTAQGSQYTLFDDGTTIRFKASHIGHSPSDVGEKERSAKTVFINGEFAKEVGMWGSSSSRKKRLVLSGGKVYLISWNEGLGKFGLDKIYGDSTYTNSPTVGKHPLELWDRADPVSIGLNKGVDVYKSSHPGGKIVEIG